ncbi:MAG: tetratricopeptide repeat protein [Cyclobacteriaceae bacterium]|nr:tetratricopeptide repeat protein [Cyclobacteriaceae bacterium]
MAKDYKKKTENKIVKLFEEHVRNKTSFLFEIEQFEEIINYYSVQNELKKALTACQSAESQFPYSIDILILKAQTLSGLDQDNDALSVLELAENLQPNEPEIFMLRGSIFSILGEFENAIEEYEKAIDLVDNKDEVYHHLGLVYQDMENYDRAIDYLKKAISINVKNENALYDLAYCLDITDRKEESISFYTKFIDEDPYSSLAWYNLGILYVKLSQLDNAIKAFDYAVVIEDDFASAHFNLGSAYLQNEQYQDALNSFIRTMNIEGPGAELYYLIASAYQNISEFEIGLKYHQKASKLDSLYHEPIFGAGFCLGKLDRWYEAVHFFNKALKINTENALYWRSMAEADYKVGNLVSSLDAYEESAMLDSTDHQTWIDWSFLVYEQGDISKAIRLIERGLEELPEVAELHYRLTAYFLANGMHKDGLKSLENALVLNFEKHSELLEFFSELKMQKALYKIIEKHRKENL